MEIELINIVIQTDRSIPWLEKIEAQNIKTNQANPQRWPGLFIAFPLRHGGEGGGRRKREENE